MRIIIRTDASQQIGSGHVMRCLTLAESLRGFDSTVEFITRSHVSNLDKLIKNKGFKVYSLPNPSKYRSQQSLKKYTSWLGVQQDLDANETIQILTGESPDYLIVDHYALDYKWENKLRPYAKKIMVIDDLANRTHDCDVLLDQNYVHDQGRYHKLLSPSATQLLGPKYTLLRKEFEEICKDRQQSYDTIKSVFIFFGGIDVGNLTTMALEVLMHPNLIHLSLNVVIGANNPYQDMVMNQIEKHPHAKLHVQVDNMAELMKESDIVLGAGGSTIWEWMSIGLPSIVVTTAENQISSVKSLAQDNYIKWLGNIDQVSKQIISKAFLEAMNNSKPLCKQSRKSQELVDGNGTQSVAKLLTIGPSIQTLEVRRAKISDSLLYWHWANDPTVRINAFNQHKIRWEEHQAWFNERLADFNTKLLLIESEAGPVGQVRLNRSDSNYIISYSIARQFRGLSLGQVVLTKAIDYLRQREVATLIGDVKENNLASIKIFNQLGFDEVASHQKGVIRFQLHNNILK